MSDLLKNLFDFGTGSIDKDQWLRDIDNEQDKFYGTYSSAVNKHRATLMRQALQDIRQRLASGDMLNRSADGTYNFGSALNNEDKHMQDAYERALGFIGGLARRLINTPKPEEEKKVYNTSLLNKNWIKYNNPSGKFFTSVWNKKSEEQKINALKDFLTREKGNLDKYGEFGEYDDKANLEARILAFLDAPNSENLQRLGFDRDYFNLTAEEAQEETQPKTKQEELLQELNDIEQEKKNKALQLEVNFAKHNTGVNWLNFTVNPVKEEDLFKAFMSPRVAMTLGMPRNFGYDHQNFLSQLLTRMNDYFKDFGIKYHSLYDVDKGKTLAANLSKLLSKDGNNYTISNYTDILTPIKGGYLINGSVNKETGRYSVFDPKRGIAELSYDENTADPAVKEQFFSAFKLGGILKALNGLPSYASNYMYHRTRDREDSEPLIEEDTQETSPAAMNFSNSENARLAAVAADILSMGAAFVPGYGTATSAALGLGSTLTNLGADIADGVDGWTVAKNAGMGLAADVMGLIPGLGGAGKGAKIARNLMWAVPKLMQWANTYQGLKNIGEIKNSITKLTSPSSMTLLDWQNVQQALQIVTGHGRSIASKAKNAGMKKTTTTSDPEHYVFTNAGQKKVTQEQFNKLREVRGTKERQALAEDLLGKDVKLLQVRFAPWNTSTKFGAFREVPGKTVTKVDGTKTGWKGHFRDENIHQAVINHDSNGFDIRSIMHKVNPYKSYYLKARKSSPLPEYLERPSNVLPEGFGVTREGMKNGGFEIKDKQPKTRKPLTLEQKDARKAKRAEKKAAAEAKLKQLKEQQNMSSRIAMQEEIPQASSLTVAKLQAKERLILSQPYANLQEIPAPKPINPQVESFNKKYGRALRTHEIGGKLIALRRGGIIKAENGTLVNWGDTEIKWNNMTGALEPEQPLYTNPYFPKMEAKGTPEWFKNRFNNTALLHLVDSKKYNNPNLQGRYTGTDLDFTFGKNMAYVKSGQENKQKDIQSYFDNSPMLRATNLEELTNVYNSDIDLLYNTFNKDVNSPDYKNTDATEHNKLFKKMYGSRATGTGDLNSYDIGWDENQIGTFGSNSFARRPVNYETKFVDDLKNNIAQAKDRVSKVKYNDIEGYVYTDVDGKIYPVSPEQMKLLESNTTPTTPEVKPDNRVKGLAVEKLTQYRNAYKNPYDPTLGLIATKVGMGLLGNKNIYENLEKELPSAVLKDPINRELAIVGNQRAIMDADNEAADMLNATKLTLGSDMMLNWATMAETHRINRLNKLQALKEDLARQFDTALKSWAIDNEDVIDARDTAFTNAQALRDRQLRIAQARAARRSGDQNLIMGGISDAANWLMKKYQEEQDLVNQTKQLDLGSLDEYVASNTKSPEYQRLASKIKAGTATPADKEQFEQIKYDEMKRLRGEFSKKYYDLYGNKLFGGGIGTSLAFKDGGSLEKEKLRQRGKDNDRYIKAFIELRKTNRRRRR